MGKTIYTAEATVTGGRKAGHGASSDGNLEVDIRMPKDLGGEEDGTNPEQLFAVGYAACFESALQTVARRSKADVDDISVDSKVSLQTNEDKGFDLSVQLDVTLPSISDTKEAVELVEAAHKVCPYSNATRGNIEVNLSANGEPVV